jgi:ABC-type multidrug transport system ATPase subunit
MAPRPGVPSVGRMDEPIIETSGLTKRYPNGVLAVDSVAMTVRHGEVYGLLGPNGAGKTTTLRMLVGLIEPDSGTARVAGHEPGDPAGLVRIGSLIEYAAFYPYLSGRDNLRVVADYAGAPHARIEEVLGEVELLDSAGRRFGAYSTGMKQRLGVAAALLKQPELLILDEPTNGLDPQGMAEMRTLVRRLGRGERTVLLSSHLLGEVEQICDRVGVISHGRLVRESTVAALRGSAGVLVRARPRDVAERMLTEMFGPGAVGQVDGALRVSTDPERSAELNSRLAVAGVAVSELRPVQRSLEEVFFQLTGEEQGS